jgi:hypothetical protein
MLLSRLLMSLSSGIALVFGAMHLLYTFHGPKLLPRDPAVRLAMEQTSPVITRETTVWQAWLGFNATHSIALILFGLVFGFLGVWESKLLFDSTYLLVVGFAVLAAFLVLSRLYFFSVPLMGVSVALACYVASIIAARL